MYRFSKRLTASNSKPEWFGPKRLGKIRFRVIFSTIDLFHMYLNDSEQYASICDNLKTTGIVSNIRQTN